MKTVTIAGRIGKNAELRRTNNGDPVASFSVAVNDRSSKDAPAFWFEVSLWGKRAESLTQYLTKGSNVTVSGELTRREYNGQTYLGVRANEVELQGGQKQEANNGGGYNASQSHQAPLGGATGNYGDMSDDIPFAMEWRG